MDRILNKNGKLINNIIYPSMVFTLVYLFGLAIGIGLNIPLQILIILAISIIVKFLLLNPLFLYILLLLIFISSLFISYFFTPYMQLLLDKAYILLVNIINHLKGPENIAPENLMVFWGILIVLVALFTSFIMFKNKKIFMLLPIYIGSFNTNHSLEVGADGEILLPKGIYSGESYSVKVLKPLPYNHLISLGIQHRKENIDNLSNYLQIPKDRITDATKKLVKDIVKNRKTDLEKALAIEEYLRNNYNYSLDVEIVPENREFIDYFLFESQEGYCTYYATAMAIMLRIEGIPTRYIEGYLAQDLIREDIYEVKHRNAHTWVEAFIEPVGWMTFFAVLQLF